MLQYQVLQEIYGGKETNGPENHSPELCKRPGSVTWGHCSIAVSPRTKSPKQKVRHESAGLKPDPLASLESKEGNSSLGSQTVTCIFLMGSSPAE